MNTMLNVKIMITSGSLNEARNEPKFWYETKTKLGLHSLRYERELTIEYIQRVVCNYFDMDYKVFKAKSRKREIVQARQIAMYFSKNYTNASLSTIGYEIGGKDHSTVLHACKTIRDLLDTEKCIQKYVKEIDLMLKY